MEISEHPHHTVHLNAPHPAALILTAETVSKRSPWKKCERSPGALWSTQLGDGPQTSSHGRPRRLSAGF